MTHSLPSDRKSVLRTTMFRRRATANALHGQQAGVALAATAERLFERLPEGVVSCYLPIRTELDTLPLISLLVSSGRIVVLPTLVKGTRRIAFRRWSPGDPTVVGSFDVTEPTSAAEILDPDILLVPLLAFDGDNYRLGYGGGYYDTTIEALQRERTITAIGIAYDEQELVCVPREPHDQQLNQIMTPSGVREPTSCRSATGHDH